MLTFIVISGGMLDEEVLLGYYKENIVNNREQFKIIAVDRGLEYAISLNIDVDYVVGDFDTIKSDIISEYKANNAIKHVADIREYKPEKDLTDTHIALELALDNGANDIVIFGATGGRIDHLLANISLLSIALDRGVSAWIIDSNNKIYIINKNTELIRDKLYGKYVSLLAYYADVKGLTLKGFKYLLNDYTLLKDDSLGISNEVVEASAWILMDKGKLIVIESRD